MQCDQFPSAVRLGTQERRPTAGTVSEGFLIISDKLLTVRILQRFESNRRHNLTMAYTGFNYNDRQLQMRAAQVVPLPFYFIRDNGRYINNLILAVSNMMHLMAALSFLPLAMDERMHCIFFSHFNVM